MCLHAAAGLPERRCDSTGLVRCAGLAVAIGQCGVRAFYTQGLTGTMALSCPNWQTAGNTFEQTGCPTALLFPEIGLCLHCSQRVVDMAWAPSVWVSARQACASSCKLWEGPSAGSALFVCGQSARGCPWAGWGGVVPPLVRLQLPQVVLTVKTMSFSHAPCQSTRLTVITNGLQIHIFKKPNS